MAPGGRDKAVHDAVWDEHFQAFKAYYEAHGVYPQKKNDNEKLARWVYKQRCRAKKNRLCARRIALLNSLNFDWGFPLPSAKLRRDPVDPRRDAAVSRRDHDAVDKHDADARTDAKVGSRASRGRPDFRFKVRIPSYYEEIPEVGKDSFSCNEAITEDALNETKGEEHGKAGTSECTNTIPDGSAALDDYAERAKHHKDFISALEKYGSNAGSEEGTVAWHAMAKELKWHIKDVKVYAYSYFKALTEGNLQAGGSNNSDTEDNATHEASGIQSSWTRDELILLDSLMLKYCKSLNDLNHVHGDRNSSGSSYLIRNPSAWENIAANLPGKTSKECYEMGTLRLRTLDINNKVEDRHLTADSRTSNLLNPREEMSQSKISTMQNVAEVGHSKDDDLRTVASKQHRLLVLRHSSQCQAEDGKCSKYAQCAEMRVLWQHMSNCREGNCAVKYCKSSRNILRHYLNCREDCETCAPLRDSSSNVLVGDFF
ncbi:hypothetical protein HJC23_008510 [Cyclotella cryptica]|uniref:histone acetyltransferase n=1 Tax=Cyclotella cryptica TaxID=29204 RepID=A0ABD3QWQ9_9STRA|eukprot:CCRYP_001262-RA/>CCRYP_001262-RA protein AED:0.00 eAED:0.00 QI:306/-1/1/1/-1/1/1/36/484